MTLLAAGGEGRCSGWSVDCGPAIDRGARIPEARSRPLPPAIAATESPTCSAQVTTLRGAMAERRILETTQLLGALPPDDARDAPIGRRPSATSPATRCSSARAIPPPSCSASSPAGRHPDPLARRPRVAGRGARRGLAVRRARPVRRRSPVGRRPCTRGDAASLVLDYEAVRARDRGEHADAALDHRAPARSPAAHHRRDARRRGVPRRARAHREAAARDRRRRRRVPAAA